MRNRVSLTVVDPTNSNDLLFDWSAEASNIVATNNSHGFEGLSFSVPYDDKNQAVQNMLGTVVWVAAGPDIVWEGRIEDFAITSSDTMSVRAAGKWSATADHFLNATYVQTGYDNWEIMRQNIYAFAYPGRFNMSTNEGLRWSTKAGERYTTTTFAMIYYELPEGDTEQILEVEFDYSLSADTGWRLQCQGWATPWSSADAAGWSVDSTGGTASGTGTVMAVSNRTAISFILFRHTSTLDPETNDSEDQSAQITNITVRTIQDPILPNTIAEDIVGKVSADATAPKEFETSANSVGLNEDTSGIEDVEGATSMNLTDVAFYGTSAQKSLMYLATMGNLDGEQVEVGVWEDGKLFFRKTADWTKTWYIESSDVSFVYSLDDLANSLFINYRDGNGRRKQSDVSTNEDSIAAYHAKKEHYLDIETKCECVVNSFKETQLAKFAFPPPRISLTLDDSGTRDYWQIRANDTIVIQNIPFSVTTETATLLVESVGYDIDSGTITISPLYNPDLDYGALSSLDALKKITSIPQSDKRRVDS